jgi:hypothetical protein
MGTAKTAVAAAGWAHGIVVIGDMCWNRGLTHGDDLNVGRIAGWKVTDRDLWLWSRCGDPRADCQDETRDQNEPVHSVRSNLHEFLLFCRLSDAVPRRVPETCQELHPYVGEHIGTEPEDLAHAAAGYIRRGLSGLHQRLLTPLRGMRSDVGLLRFTSTWRSLAPVRPDAWTYRSSGSPPSALDHRRHRQGRLRRLAHDGTGVGRDTGGAPSLIAGGGARRSRRARAVQMRSRNTAPAAPRGAVTASPKFLGTRNRRVLGAS